MQRQIHELIGRVRERRRKSYMNDYIGRRRPIHPMLKQLFVYIGPPEFSGCFNLDFPETPGPLKLYYLPASRRLRNGADARCVLLVAHDSVARNPFHVRGVAWCGGAPTAAGVNPGLHLNLIGLATLNTRESAARAEQSMEAGISVRDSFGTPPKHHVPTITFVILGLPATATAVDMPVRITAPL